MRDFHGTVLVPVGGAGPEDVLVDGAGRVYTGLSDGRIVRTAGPGAPVETIAQVPGRPLGLEFLGDDDLVVCASDAGLLAVSLTDGRVRTLVQTVAGHRLLACNNAAVAPDGTIFFSDSSRRFTVPQFQQDLVQRTCTGRLLRRDLDGSVTEVLSGLDFANGVAVAADGSYVAVAETGACRLTRLWLSGERAGRAEVFVDGLGGYPDNISLGSDGLIWVALASPPVPLLTRIRRLPAPLRSLARRAPDRFQPAPLPAVGVVAVDDSGRTVVELDGEVPGFTVLTGVREAAGTLWFGSLFGRSLATLAR